MQTLGQNEEVAHARTKAAAAEIRQAAGLQAEEARQAGQQQGKAGSLAAEQQAAQVRQASQLQTRPPAQQQDAAASPAAEEQPGQLGQAAPQWSSPPQIKLEGACVQQDSIMQHTQPVQQAQQRSQSGCAAAVQPDAGRPSADTAQGAEQPTLHQRQPTADPTSCASTVPGSAQQVQVQLHSKEHVQQDPEPPSSGYTADWAARYSQYLGSLVPDGGQAAGQAAGLRGHSHVLL